MSAAMILTGCQDQGVTNSTDGGGVDPNADLHGQDQASSSGDDMPAGSSDMRGAAADMRGAPADMRMSGPPEGNPTLNGITQEHNNARAAVTPVPATPLPPLTWNTTVATAAQNWANNCMFNA